MLKDQLSIPSPLVPKTKTIVPSELNFASWALSSLELIFWLTSKVTVDVISNAVLKEYWANLPPVIPVIYILVPVGLKITVVGVPVTPETSKSSTKVGSA